MSTPEVHESCIFPRDLVEAAWGLIANGWGGDWGAASPEWRAAAEEWREAYHGILKSVVVEDPTGEQMRAAVGRGLHAYLAACERDGYGVGGGATVKAFVDAWLCLDRLTPRRHASAGHEIAGSRRTRP